MQIIKKSVGTVDINYDKLDITDPCYDKDTWCRINDIQVKPGKYSCKYWESIDDKRPMIAVLMQLHRSFDINSKKWQNIGSIGVDSGLAGFFWNKSDFNNDEWQDFCNKLKNKTVWLDPNMGFWTSSGYGDGVYDVYAIKENNEIIALKIEF